MHMHNVKRGFIGLGAAAVVAASLISSGAAVAQDEKIIGVSWNNYNEERWKNSDEPAIKAAVEAAGYKYVNTDAKSSAEQQLADVEQLITGGADALIILAQDQEAILPAIRSAEAAGIPVIAYDRIIDDPYVLYQTFDNVGVGKAMAEAVFPLVPKGNYAIIKGNPGDENPEFLRAGMEEVLGQYWAPGDPDSHDPITIVCEVYTDNWLAEKAQENMDNCLTATDNNVQAVLAENDGMAGGVIAALEAQGLHIPVSGQDGDNAALNRVATGRQTVSVWKDSRVLGKAAGEAAVAMAEGGAKDSIEGTAPFTSPKGNTLTSFFLPLDVLTQANVGEAVERGKIDLATLCAGADPTVVPVCADAPASPAASPAS
jgi:D-xylose transport system substrate-binding protein